MLGIWNLKFGTDKSSILKLIDMKTKITFLNTACRAIVVAAVFLFMVVPSAMAQEPEVPWYIAFSGHNTEHEGIAAWDADGTGDEPYGVGPSGSHPRL